MDKKYVGTAKAKQGKYGEYYLISFKKEELEGLENDKGYYNFIMSPRKSEGKYGETHTIAVNDWKPEDKPKAKQYDDDIAF